MDSLIFVAFDIFSFLENGNKMEVIYITFDN